MTDSLVSCMGQGIIKILMMMMMMMNDQISLQLEGKGVILRLKESAKMNEYVYSDIQ